MRRFKFITILFIIFYTGLFSHTYAQDDANTDDKTGIYANPARIDIQSDKYEYEINVTNYYSQRVDFQAYIDKYDGLPDDLSDKLSIVPYAFVNRDKFSLAPQESTVFKFAVNPELKDINSPLYGKVKIITNYAAAKQTTINQGFAIPIFKSYKKDYIDGITIKNVDFKKDFWNVLGASSINFDIVNSSQSINKLFGEYYIKKSNGEIIFHKAISTVDYTIFPNQTRNFKDKTNLNSLIESYTLEVAITDDQGNIIRKETKTILVVNPILTAGVLIGIGLIIFLIIKRKKFLKFLYRDKKIAYNKYASKIASILILVPMILIFSTETFAQALNSASYKIPQSDFASGNNSTSTTYRVRDANGVKIQGASTSTSYGVTNGITALDYAYVPTAPILSNNSSLYYDRLLLKLSTTATPPGNNPTDTDFAIVVTSSSFSGIRYVLSTNTLASTLNNNSDWRKFNTGSPNWNGSTGTEVSGLAPNTSYTFYVKARHRYNTSCVSSTCNIPSSETPIILLPSAKATPNTTISTSSTILAFQILGITAGGINDITSTATSVNFGNISSGISRTASNTLRVTTNAQNGYTVTVAANQKLAYGSNNIDWFTGSSATYSLPQTWSSPTGTYPNAGWIGYYTQNANVSQFSGIKFAPFPVSPSSDIIVTYSTPQTGVAQDDTMTYRIEINLSQPAGAYSGMTLTYILTGKF